MSALQAALIGVVAALSCFLVNYLNESQKNPGGHEAAVTVSLERAAQFAANQCMVDGSWGHGVRY